MNELTKKRAKALMIDSLISSVVAGALEPLIKKKVKTKFVYTVILPSVMLWGLEAAQIGLSGQTLGQKAMGIKIVTSDGNKPTTCQLLKRAVHRDSITTIAYLKNRHAFEGKDGTVLPQDRYADTRVTML